MYQASSSNKPVRRRRSNDEGCGRQEWTCALIQEDPMQVKWYCPVGSKERLGNKADLMRYWRKHHGHDRVPSCFNFLAKDVPSWCERLNGIEEEAVRSSYGGGSQGRGTLTYVGALVSPNPLSAVVTPKLATKVPVQAFSQGSSSTSDTAAPTPVNSSRREGKGPAVAPVVGVRVAVVRSPTGAAGQENELPRGGKQGGVPGVKQTALSSRTAAGTRERYAHLSECSAASTPPSLSRAGVSALKMSHGNGKFDAFPYVPTPGGEYMRQTDSEMEEQGVGEDSDDVEFTQLDPGVAAQLAAAAIAPAVTAESKQESNDWMELSGDSDRAADDASSEWSSADGGVVSKMDSARELGDEAADRHGDNPTGEDSSIDSTDDDQMDVVISDDGEDSGDEWVAPQEADIEPYISSIEGDDKANVVSSGAAEDERLLEHAKPVRRVRRSLRGRESKPLPTAPQACQFLLETQRFAYKKGKGWAMIAKDDSMVLEYDETPQYIGDRLQIFEEFEEWSRQKASKEGEDTSSNEGGDGEEDHGRVVLSVSESDCSICESDEEDEVKGESSGKGDGYDNDCNVGSNMDDGGANQRRVATRRKSARFHSQKPNVPRLQAVWDFLSNEKKWKYIKVGGEYMVAGPDPDNGPVLQSQLQDFMADHRDLLEECKDWLGEQESEEEEPPRQPSRGRVSPALAQRRSPRLSEVEQDLPESRYAWQFVREEKDWDYHKDGFHIVGPEPDDIPIEFRELPNFIAENARLRRDYNKWRRDLEIEEESQKKRKMREKGSGAKRRAQQQKVKTPRETSARQASASEDKNSTGKRRKLLREPIPSRTQKKEQEGGGRRKRCVRGARSGSDTESKTSRKKIVSQRSARHEDLSIGVLTVAVPSSESEADSGDSAVDDPPREAQRVEEEDESSEEEIKAGSEGDWSDNGEDSESMDEEEKRTLLMRDLRLEDMNRLYVWQFLREEEDWTYRNGGLESSHIYFKKGTPRDAEIGVHIFRSLEEVRDMVRRDPALRKRFYEYYQKDMLASSSKVEPAGSNGPNGATSKDANTVSNGSAACHQEAKAMRDSVSPAAASVAPTATDVHAVCGSKSGIIATSVVGTKASSRYTKRATGRTSDKGMEEDEPSPSPQQNRKRQKNTKAGVSSVRSSRTPRSSARVSEIESLPPEDDKKKVGGPKKRVKSSQATPRDKQTIGGASGRRSSSSVASEAEFIDPPEFPGPKESTCGVCLGPGSADGSDMFFQCREPRCSSRVHKSCYPVNVRSIHDEFFRCNACVASSTEPKLRGCAICRRTQGVDGYAMIPTKDGQLVHYLCFKKVVKTAENHQFFDKATKKFSPPGGVTEALARAASRRVKPCRVCHRTGGVLKRCFRVDCKTRFHALCGAVRSAEVLNESGEGMGLGADMAILCETHVEQADKDCSVCEQPGTVGDMIACCRCDTHYHKACLNPPMTSNEENEGEATNGWICTNCKSACASLTVDGSEDDDDVGDEGEEEAIDSSQDDEAQEEEEPPVPGSPEWIGWQCRQAKKTFKGKVKAKGKGKTKSNSPVPKNPSPLANQGPKGRSAKGRVKATKAGGGGRSSSARKYALERRRALEAMWSSCEDDDDEYGSSDGEGDSEDGIATSYANASKPRTEAFTAIPVGAQAYFNSHAGVKTLAVVTGGVVPAEGSRSGSGVGASKGAVTTRVVHKRGWHARNKYTRAAREDRLSEERAGRKRARRDAGGGTESAHVGDGLVDDEEEEDWEAAGAGMGMGTAGGSAFFGEGGEARVEELLRLTQNPVRDQLDALMSKHAHNFARWKSEMDWGWSLLFYGVGSKRELLQRLEDYVGHQCTDRGAIVGYDGFNANASVRGLLDSLCEEVLYRKSQELSSTSLQTYASNFVKAFESEHRRSAMSNASRMSRPRLTASIGGDCRGAQEGDSLRRSSVASGRTARDGVDRFFETESRAVPRRLFIFVSSIDGEKLRNEDSQAALAELSASPVVHLAASIDHVNAPLMWDVGLAGKFNWAWHKTHTYQPYVEELRNRRAWCSEEDEVLALSRLSMVMKALTPRHFDVVVCLAKKLKSSPELGGKWNYKELLAELKSNLSADNSQILDLLLVELKDHNVLTDEKTGNSRFLSIPGGPEVIDYLAGYQR